MFSSRPQITDVFTPRSPFVNNKMYIPRPTLEKHLKRNLEGSFHTIVHGESGGGKTWLYKKVLAELNAVNWVANCGNISRFGSITQEIQNLLNNQGIPVKRSYEDSINGKMGAFGMEASSERKIAYDTPSPEPLLACFQIMRQQAGDNGLAVLVFDNLEMIIQDNKLMKELADIIILLDEEQYAKYNIKLLIVGIPTNVQTYFARINNQAPISNRIQEVPEVSRLDKSQVSDFVKKGFVEELKMSIAASTLDFWQSYVYWVTDGIPQRIHEYCLQLAYVCEDNDWKVKIDLLKVADKQWLLSSLSPVYTTISNAMNDKTTKIGRRNQVLYTLGQIETRTFNSNDIEALLRKHFPNSTKGVDLNVSQMLAYLAELDNPIIRQTPKGNAYQFADPKYLMCIRAMLYAQNETVSKIEIDTLLDNDPV